MSYFSQLPRLARTLRHLRGEQLAYQIWYRLARHADWRLPLAFTSGSLRIRPWPRPEPRPPSGADACLDSDRAVFEFINLEKDFKCSVDWSKSGHGKLWDYNLHYFEWLWGLSPERAREWTTDWLKRHPFGRKAVGWESYPLSLRVMNWLAYWGTRGYQELEGHPEFHDALAGSLGSQCDWLTKRLEKHLLGNHFLENGAALFLAGSLLDSKYTDTWKQIGGAILKRELPEQVLPDGMHFERSPMYHMRLLHVLEWLCMVDASFSGYLERVRKAAAQLQHPDWHIALFNDSAFGIYPEYNGAAASPGAFSLPDAGYYGMRTGEGDYMICDAGRIGPNYIPGHAHCDIGSFELSLAGSRFITDTGVHDYMVGPSRRQSRSTAAHNAFSPEGVEQAEIWGAFRVGNRPDVKVLSWQLVDGGGFALELSHDGFKRAGKRTEVEYRRKFACTPRGQCIIEDQFGGPEDWVWSGRLHFAPGVSVLESGTSHVLLGKKNVRLNILLEDVSQFHISESAYYPRFNIVNNRPCLTYQAKGSQGFARIILDWSETLKNT